MTAMRLRRVQTVLDRLAPQLKRRHEKPSVPSEPVHSELLALLCKGSKKGLTSLERRGIVRSQAECLPSINDLITTTFKGMDNEPAIFSDIKKDLDFIGKIKASERFKSRLLSHQDIDAAFHQYILLDTSLSKSILSLDFKEGLHSLYRSLKLLDHYEMILQTIKPNNVNHQQSSPILASSAMLSHYSMKIPTAKFLQQTIVHCLQNKELGSGVEPIFTVCREKLAQDLNQVSGMLIHLKELDASTTSTDKYQHFFQTHSIRLNFIVENQTEFVNGSSSSAFIEAVLRHQNAILFQHSHVGLPPMPAHVKASLEQFALIFPEVFAFSRLSFEILNQLVHRYELYAVNHPDARTHPNFITKTAQQKVTEMYFQGTDVITNYFDSGLSLADINKKLDSLLLAASYHGIIPGAKTNDSLIFAKNWLRAKMYIAQMQHTSCSSYPPASPQGALASSYHGQDAIKSLLDAFYAHGTHTSFNQGLLDQSFEQVFLRLASMNYSEPIQFRASEKATSTETAQNNKSPTAMDAQTAKIKQAKKEYLAYGGNRAKTLLEESLQPPKTPSVNPLSYSELRCQVGYLTALKTYIINFSTDYSNDAELLQLSLDKITANLGVLLKRTTDPLPYVASNADSEIKTLKRSPALALQNKWYETPQTPAIGASPTLFEFHQLKELKNPQLNTLLANGLFVSKSFSYISKIKTAGSMLLDHGLRGLFEHELSTKTIISRRSGYQGLSEHARGKKIVSTLTSLFDTHPALSKSLMSTYLLAKGDPSLYKTAVQDPSSLNYQPPWYQTALDASSEDVKEEILGNLRKNINDMKLNKTPFLFKSPLFKKTAEIMHEYPEILRLTLNLVKNKVLNESNYELYEKLVPLARQQPPSPTTPALNSDLLTSDLGTHGRATTTKLDEKKEIRIFSIVNLSGDISSKTFTTDLMKFVSPSKLSSPVASVDDMVLNAASLVNVSSSTILDMGIHLINGYNQALGSAYVHHFHSYLQSLSAGSSQCKGRYLFSSLIHDYQQLFVSRWPAMYGQTIDIQGCDAVLDQKNTQNIFLLKYGFNEKGPADRKFDITSTLAPLPNELKSATHLKYVLTPTFNMGLTKALAPFDRHLCPISAIVDFSSPSSDINLLELAPSDQVSLLKSLFLPSSNPENSCIEHYRPDMLSIHALHSLVESTRKMYMASVKRNKFTMSYYLNRFLMPLDRHANLTFLQENPALVSTTQDSRADHDSLSSKPMQVLTGDLMSSFLGGCFSKFRRGARNFMLYYSGSLPSQAASASWTEEEKAFFPILSLLIETPYHFPGEDETDDPSDPNRKAGLIYNPIAKILEKARGLGVSKDPEILRTNQYRPSDVYNNNTGLPIHGSAPSDTEGAGLLNPSKHEAEGGDEDFINLDTSLKLSEARSVISSSIPESDDDVFNPMYLSHNEAGDKVMLHRSFLMRAIIDCLRPYESSDLSLFARPQHAEYYADQRQKLYFVSQQIAKRILETDSYLQQWYASLPAAAISHGTGVLSQRPMQVAAESKHFETTEANSLHKDRADSIDVKDKKQQITLSHLISDIKDVSHEAFKREHFEISSEHDLTCQPKILITRLFDEGVPSPPLGNVELDVNSETGLAIRAPLERFEDMYTVSKAHHYIAGSHSLDVLAILFTKPNVL